MTDKEKAREWVRTNSGYSTKEFHGKKAIEAYLAGAEFGYNKAKDENAELKEQIEQMKCCENCRYYSHTYEHCYSYESYQNCKALSNWRLAE